jgi:hypothetical protein
MKSFVLISKYYWSDQVKEDEMGGMCSIHRRMKMHTKLIKKPEGKERLNWIQVTQVGLGKQGSEQSWLSYGMLHHFSEISDKILKELCYWESSLWSSYFCCV